MTGTDVSLGGAETGREAASPGCLILSAMLADCPPATLTLSSTNPRFGCQARTLYLPAGTSAMLKLPFAAVFAE